MRDYGVEELGVFFIGESFLCQWLPEAIAEAKKVGFPYVFLTTNGSAASEKKLKQCMENGLDSLKFSLNFYEPAQLNQIAKVDERYFAKAIEAVKVARRIRDEGGHNCGIYASSIAFDGEQGEKMRRLVADIEPYVDEHYWLPLFSMREASERSGMKPIVGNPGRLAKMRGEIRRERDAIAALKAEWAKLRWGASSHWSRRNSSPASTGTDRAERKSTRGLESGCGAGLPRTP